MQDFFPLETPSDVFSYATFNAPCAVPRLHLSLETASSFVCAVVSLCAGLLASHLHIFRSTLRQRYKQHLPVQYRVTFSDVGFEVSPGPDRLVTWDEVHRVQSTADLYMVDFCHEGRTHILMLPTELVDTELATFIRDRTQGN